MTELEGKRVLVGLKYLNARGEETDRVQYTGTIVSGGGDEPIVLRRHDTDELVELPPELEEAAPGEYRLRSTGEVIVDPDYIAAWIVKTE
jgi:hypothetical protein